MLAVQPSSFGEGEKKLRAVAFFPRASHRNQTAVHEAQARVRLRVERSPERAVTAIAGAGRISCLRADFAYNAMKNAVVVIALHAQLYKIPAGLRRLLRPQLDINVANCSFQNYLARGCGLQNGGHSCTDDFVWPACLLLRRPACSSHASSFMRRWCARIHIAQSSSIGHPIYTCYYQILLVVAVYSSSPCSLLDCPCDPDTRSTSN
jgi:hypothetical protein